MSDRLEREIEDVLSNIDDFEWHRRRRSRPSKLRRAWDRWWQGASDAIGRRLASFTAGHLMLVGFLILLAGLVFRARGLGTWFVLAGVIIFVLALFLNMRSGRARARGEPSVRGGYWRDRYVSYEPEARGLRRLFRRRPRSRH